MVKGDEVTIDCPCCRKEEPPEPDPRQCYEITGWSATPIGTPGCATTAELEIVRRYIEKPVGSSPTPGEVQAAIDGAFTVDCSMEESGFCRARGSSGLYPWTSAVYESSSGEGEVFSYSYLFEDCKLDDADLEITIDLRYLGPGPCPGAN
jgi:hypothetical protein